MVMRPNLYIYLDAPVDNVSYFGKFLNSKALEKSNLFHHILNKQYFDLFILTYVTGCQKYSEPWK